MFESPEGWIALAIALLLAYVRYMDRRASQREARAYSEGTDRRQHNTGNPNGLTRLTDRFDKFEAGHKTEWEAQRRRDGELHEKINAVSDRVARIEGARE